MKRAFSAFVAAAALLLAAPAMAASALTMNDGEAWQHAETGFSVPVTADGFRRLEGRDHGISQSDVMFQYDDPKTQTRATLYIYRPGSADLSIWADRAEVAMFVAESNYGKFDRGGRRWSLVTPWNNARDSAIQVVYPASGAQIKATGLLIARHGDWLIKIRMTSLVMSPTELEGRLASFMAALSFPAAKTGAKAAYAVADCKDKLGSNSAKQISRVRKDEVTGTAAINATIPGGVLSEPGAKPGDPSVFCRDASSNPRYGVYRTNGRKDHYIMAIGDGGVTMISGPDVGAHIKKLKPQFSVTILTTDRAIGLLPYGTLPSPKQAFDSLGDPQAVYAVSRLPGKEKEVQVFSSGK